MNGQMSIKAEKSVDLREKGYIIISPNLNPFCLKPEMILAFGQMERQRRYDAAFGLTAQSAGTLMWTFSKVTVGWHPPGDR